MKSINNKCVVDVQLIMQSNMVYQFVLMKWKEKC